MSSDRGLISFFKTWFEVGYYVIQGKRDPNVSSIKMQEIINQPSSRRTTQPWEEDILHRIKRNTMLDKLQWGYDPVDGLMDSGHMIKSSITDSISCYMILWNMDNYYHLSPLTIESRTFGRLEIQPSSEDVHFYTSLILRLRDEDKERKHKNMINEITTALPRGIGFRC